jgi:hypothetical protein
MTPGRPTKRDWEAERTTIETLVKQGYGYARLAKHYGVSTTGMRGVLQRLGLVTKWATP